MYLKYSLCFCGDTLNYILYSFTNKNSKAKACHLPSLALIRNAMYTTAHQIALLPDLELFPELAVIYDQ